MIEKSSQMFKCFCLHGEIDLDCIDFYIGNLFYIGALYGKFDSISLLS